MISYTICFLSTFLKHKQIFNKNYAGVFHAINKVLMQPGNKCLTQTFCGYLEANGFTILFKVLTDTGLCDKLDGLDEGTLFAPTDEAFSKLPPETVDCLTDENNSDALTDILLYHVTESELDSNTLTSDNPGTTFMIDSTGGDIVINDSSKVKDPFDVDIQNGEYPYLFLILT